MASLTNLAGTAQQLLDAYVAQLQALDISLPTDPTSGALMAYVVPGQNLSLDSEALTVNVNGIKQGTAGHSQQGIWTIAAAFVQSCEFSINLARAVAVVGDNGGLPSPADMTADALVNIADLEAMRDATMGIMGDYTFQEPGLSWTLNALDTFGPDGGMAGVRLILELSVI